jgi:hypothetical protein
MFGCKNGNCASRRQMGVVGAMKDTRTETPPLLDQVAAGFRLTTGESLLEASHSRLLVLVFLRHFGCTFTRQLLRGLEELQHSATELGGELVLVHMLKSGGEIRYLGSHGDVARIADPRCDLYRAFGLGRGGILELFGPRVWWLGTVAIFKGCGVGHLAGDGLQMPGAFLFRDGEILASQRAKSASDMPDIPGLFAQLREAPSPS